MSEQQHEPAADAERGAADHATPEPAPGPAAPTPEAGTNQGPDSAPGEAAVTSGDDAADPDPGPDLSAAVPRTMGHTGNPVVDTVLDSLRELDELPPSEHVAVFEAAHERLRGALADAGEPPADS